MGITVVSSTSVSSAAAGLNTPSLTDTVPGDFAALLSTQTFTSPSEKLIGEVGLAQISGKRLGLFDQTDAASVGQTSIATDSSILAAMLGMPASHVAPATIAQPDTAVLSKEFKSAAGSLDKPEDLLGERRRPMDSGKAEQLLLGSQGSPPQSAAPSSNTANIAGDLLPNTGSAPNFGAALANAASMRQSGEVAQPIISSPLHSKAWPEQFGEKIVWMAKNDHQSDQISINPPQLGPMQITLHLNGDQANAIFASPHAEVRQAIEAAMPQLREMLQSAGITLGDTNVGANMAQQNQSNPFSASNRNQSGHENAILPANEDPVSAVIGEIVHRGNGLVDLFA